MKCVLCGRNEFELLFTVRGFDIQKCNGCQLVKTLQKPTANYEEYHRDEAEYTKDEKLFENIFKKRFNTISRFKKTPGSILDIGSSTGTMLSIFKEHGWEVSGIEPSRGAAAIAQKRGIKTKVSTFEKAKLPTNHFDVVIMNHTFEHVNDPLFVLKKIRRILKKEGIVYIDVPNFGGLDAKIKREAWGYLMPEEHTFHYTPHTLSKIFAKANIDVMWIDTWSGIFDVANPLQKLWYQLTHLRLSFFKDIVKAPFNAFTTFTNMGTGVAIIGRKI